MKKGSTIFIFCFFSMCRILQAQEIVIEPTVSVENKTVLNLLNSDTLNTEMKDSVITNLWNEVVATGLQKPLWAKGNAYNTGHFYMVPLHAAFQFKNYEWQQQFSAHFKKFVEDGKYEVEPTRLYRLQYYYLASWFMLLAVESGQDTLIPEGLFDIVFDDIDNIWNYDPMPVWKWKGLSLSEFDNLRSRVSWKLYTTQIPEKTYHRAIIDVEKFTFAIAANLKAYLKHIHADTLPESVVIDDILEFARAVFKMRVEWNDTGGWLLQPGFWTHHDDFKYAGYFHKQNPKPLPLEDIAEDVSHSHRTALWLVSLAKAADDKGKQFYDSLLAGLEKQFFDYVLLEPTDSLNTYLNFNYMDGWNGLYRWNYNKEKPDTGFGEYELSGTMLIGWWTFLGTARIKEVYKELAERFPVPDHILAIYQLRTGEPPFKNINSWYLNGWAELNCRLASVLR